MTWPLLLGGEVLVGSAGADVPMGIATVAAPLEERIGSGDVSMELALELLPVMAGSAGALCPDGPHPNEDPKANTATKRPNVCEPWLALSFDLNMRLMTTDRPSTND